MSTSNTPPSNAAAAATLVVEPSWRGLRWLGVSALVVLLDQASKYWIVSTMAYLDEIPVTSFFSWVRWHNEGAAFSMLAGAGDWKHYFFVALASGFVLFVVWELRRLPPQPRFMGLVYGLILGGALGNLTDRLVHGHVVDFLFFHYQQASFPAFNVADSALFLGAALWLLLLWREYRAGRQHD